MRCLLAAMFMTLHAGLYGQQTGIKLYNVTDGLPSSVTYGAYQDRNGYLWVSTRAGVSRFDGRQFVNYSLEDGLPSLVVSRLLEDSRGRLWVGTNEGMVQFINNRFITYPTSDKLNNIYVFNLVETTRKAIWALTNKGVYEFADTVWKKISLLPGFENKACRNIVETKGELFINYADNLVYRNSKGRWHQIAAHLFFNVMSFQGGHILVSSEKNVYEIDEHKLRAVYKKEILSESYFSYLVDRNKRLWLAGDNFLKVSGPGNWTEISDITNQYSNYAFLSEDSSHNIWAGSMQGLLKLNGLNFSALSKQNYPLLGGIYNLIPLPENQLIFSSGTGSGLILYANAKLKQIAPPSSPGNENYWKDPVDAYTFDSKHILWLTTRFKRFLRFNGKKLEDFTGALHLKTNEHIYDIDYAKARNKLFICADSTLLYGDPQNLSAFIPRNTGVAIIKPTRVREVKNGLVLVYIDGHGVYAIDSLNNLIPLIQQTGINGSRKGIQLDVCFYEGSDDNFWIGIPGQGIYEFGFGKNRMPFLKTHLTVAEGLQSNNVHSLVSDSHGRLWIATNAGLDILAKSRTGSWEVFNYAESADLTISSYDFEKLAADADGNVWLSSPDKIIKFSTDNIHLYKEVPHIIIEKVALAFKETNWRKLSDSFYSYYELPYHPVLNYNQNSMGIFFNAIDMSTSNSDPEYAYKLIPLDTSWSLKSKIKSVSFNQLPAGTYKFLVRAKNRASGWSKPAVFVFTIKKPFWNEWWFRLIILAFATVIVIVIFRIRINKIKDDARIEAQLRELEMKALKAQMNPHFIYNALNSIQALVASNKTEEGIHYIGSFSKLLRGVLDNSENNVISLERELETLDFYIQLESLRLNMELRYQKIIDEHIDEEFEKIPPLVLQPFVENSLWHGLSQKRGEKQIKVSAALKDQWLLCTISDNGIGRKKSNELKAGFLNLHQSKAIDITRKRLQDFNEDDRLDPIVFYDLYDTRQNPTGTKVLLYIKRKTG